MIRLLLLSNSTQPGEAYLAHAETAVRSFFTDVRRLLFVPFALADRDAYTATAHEAFARWDIEVKGLHTAPDPVAAVEAAEAVFVGGGNSFRLLKTLHENGALEALRRRVRDGLPYMGASAGTNLSCPTIRTTNDMPIVEPPSLDALGVLSFQINPHYLDPDPDSKHMGETREKRLQEFHEENELPVLGLREGGWLRREGEALHLEGMRPARLFVRGQSPREIESPARLDELLEN